LIRDKSFKDRTKRAEIVYNLQNKKRSTANQLLLLFCNTVAVASPTDGFTRQEDFGLRAN
jgi:hypothetical protein